MTVKALQYEKERQAEVIRTQQVTHQNLALALFPHIQSLSL